MRKGTGSPVLTGGEKSTSILQAQETLGAFVRMRIDAETQRFAGAKSSLDVAEITRLQLLEIGHRARLPAEGPWLRRGPPTRAPACGLDCLGALNGCAAAAILDSDATEGRVPVHLHKLKTELSDLREWGHQLMETSGSPERSSSKSGSRSSGRMQQAGMRRPLFAKPRRAEEKHAAEEEETKKVYQPEISDSMLVKQLLEEKSIGKETSVHSIIQFFEGIDKPSGHVRMLELENRQLCKEKVKLKEQLREALESKEAAEKERAAAAAREAALGSSFRTKEQAFKLELDSTAAAMEALQQRLQQAHQTLEKTTDELNAARQHTQDLEAALTEKSWQHISVASRLNAVTAKTYELPEDEPRQSTETLTANGGLTDALIRLERLAWACECLGNEKLVAIESYKRAKAKEALARSEVEVYKKYLDDLVKERDTFYDTAIKTKEATVERELYFKSHLESETKRFAAALKEKDRIIFGLKEKQIANEQALKRAKQTHNECLQLIQKQRAMLKRTTGEYKELTSRVKEGSVEAQKVKKLAALIMAFMNNHKEQVTAPPPPSPPLISPGLDEQTLMSEFEKAAGAGGWLNAAEAATLCRRLGLAPSEAEIASLQEDTGDRVSLSAFGAFCRRAAHAEDDAQAVASLFEPWDPSVSGFVTKKQLKHILTSFGDCLTEEEVQFALDRLAGPGDRVNYFNFCEKLLAPNVNLKTSQGFTV